MLVVLFVLAVESRDECVARLSLRFMGDDAIIFDLFIFSFCLAFSIVNLWLLSLVGISFSKFCADSLSLFESSPFLARSRVV